MYLSWKRVGGELPKIEKDVIVFNEDTWDIDIGFRSEEDELINEWCDFPFKVTHWSYISLDEIK